MRPHASIIGHSTRVQGDPDDLIQANQATLASRPKKRKENDHEQSDDKLNSEILAKLALPNNNEDYAGNPA